MSQKATGARVSNPDDARIRAESRAKLQREHPDVLAFADLLRERFGPGVKITRLTTEKR